MEKYIPLVLKILSYPTIYLDDICKLDRYTNREIYKIICLIEYLINDNDLINHICQLNNLDRHILSRITNEEIYNINDTQVNFLLKNIVILPKLKLIPYRDEIDINRKLYNKKLLSLLYRDRKIKNYIEIEVYA